MFRSAHAACAQRYHPLAAAPTPDHRDYKRIEAASGDESRDKLNKSNGGQI